MKTTQAMLNLNMVETTMKIQRGIVKVCNIKCILNCKFWGPAGPPYFVIALKMYHNPPLHIVYVFVSDTKGSRKNGFLWSGCP